MTPVTGYGLAGPNGRRAAIAGKALLAAAGIVLAAVLALIAWLEFTGPVHEAVIVAIPPAQVPAPPAPAPAPVAAPSLAPPAPPQAAPAAAPAPAAAEPPAAPPSEPAAAPVVIALAPAPDPDLVDKTPDGPLPIISRDGRKPWQVYARPFDRGERRPRVSIVVAGLGLSKITTQDAIRELPPEIDLSFLPYHPIGEALQQARAAGHETVLDLPMEPLDYPRQDPGPRALLTSLEPRQNLDRLHWMMSRGTGYIGMITFMGSRFAASPEMLRPILVDLKQRGLAFIDGRATGDGAAAKLASEVKLPRALADRVLDSDVSRPGIEQQLAELEDLARRGGSAIGIGTAYPVTIQTVTAWAARLPEHGIILAPLSAVLAQ